MNKYIPFLKIKGGEIAAINSLEIPLQEQVTPFFDFPRNNDLNQESFMNKTAKLVRKFEINLKRIPYFYLDNFDIDSTLEILGMNNYFYLLTMFNAFPVIPVVSIDRSKDHNQSVIKAKQSDIVQSEIVAIRLVLDDFQSYELISDEINEELGDVLREFEEIDLVFDCRVCVNLDHAKLANDIIKFINSFCDEYSVRNIVVTGSSISASIADILKVNSELTIKRKEIQIYNKVNRGVGSNIVLGDYCTVSPDYSEIDIMPEMFQNIMTPKIIYTYQDKQFIQRGSGIKTHPRGSLQYNDLAKILISKAFFRGKGYSLGDDFFHEKSNGIGAKVYPGTVIKPTVNAHISYMLQDWV